MEYLARHELGLAPHRDELTCYDELVILHVASQRHALRKETDDEGPPGQFDDRETEFRAGAAPGEMDVSNKQLAEIAAQRHRR